jgi:hypothetical protein
MLGTAPGAHQGGGSQKRGAAYDKYYRDHLAKHANKQGHALFNTSFKNFVRDLTRRFPGTSEFKMILVSYKLIKTLSPKLVHKWWLVAVTPFHAQLKTHDISFFMDPDMPIPPGFEAYAGMLPMLGAILGAMGGAMLGPMLGAWLGMLAMTLGLGP